MTLSNEELRALAEAATPGPWETCPTPTDGYLDVHTAEGVFNDGETFVLADVDESDAAYIAAANPQRVLDSLDELDAAHGMLVAAETRCAELAIAKGRLEEAARALLDAHDAWIHTHDCEVQAQALEELLTPTTFGEALQNCQQVWAEDPDPEEIL